MYPAPPSIWLVATTTVEKIKAPVRKYPPVVGHDFTLVIKTMKFIGVCPLTWSWDKEANTFTSVHFRWFSPGAILSFIVSCWYSFVWMIYFLHFTCRETVFLSESYSDFLKILTYELEHSTALNELQRTSATYAMKTASAILTILMLLSIWTAWAKLNLLVTYLNGWCKFDEDFAASFEDIRPLIVCPQGDDNRRSAFNLRLFSITYVLVPQIVMTIVASYFGYVGKASVEIQLFDKLFSITAGLCLLTLQFMGDIQDMMLFLCLKRAFAQLQRAIEVSSSDELSIHQVESWKRLVQTIRGQCHILSRHQTKSELFFITGCIAMLTTSLYLVLCLPWENFNVLSTAYLWIVIPTVFMIRLFAKSHVAEQFTEQEQELGITFASINPTKAKDILPEIQDLHDMVTRKPSRIALTNLMTYDKRLLLTIMNQVVTYLIALTQFVDP